jgi:phosphate transport system permease protein
MAVLMVAGNVVQWPTSLTAPIRTVTGNIALELGYAGTEHRSVLFFTGLLLIVVVLALVAAVRWLTVGRESLNDA